MQSTFHRLNVPILDIGYSHIFNSMQGTVINTGVGEVVLEPKYCVMEYGRH
jgi:hypothetical protein